MLGTKRGWLVLLLLSILLGTGLRLIQVGNPYLLDFHSWRQADTAAFTHGYLTETLNPLDPSLDRFPCEHRDAPFGRAETELPLVPWLSALPLSLLGVDYPPAPYLRTIAILTYIATCLYLFLLARRLAGSSGTASLTVFVFSILPLSIFFTRTPQPDGPALTLTCAFLFHLDRWVESGKVQDGVLSGLAGALLFLVKVSNGFLFFPAVYLILRRHGWLGSLRSPRYWIWGIGMLVPVAAWYATANRHPWTFGIWQDKYSTFALLTDLKIWRVFSERLTFEIWTWAGLVLLVVGFALHGKSRAGRLAAVWLLSIFAFIALTIPANQTHIYYQLPLVLPASLLIAMAARSLVENGWLGRTVVTTACVLHAWISYNTLDQWLREDANLLEAVTTLRQHVSPGETIVSTSRDPRLFYNARIKGLFRHSTSVSALETCMGPDIRFLLVEKGIQNTIDKNRGERDHLARNFRPSAQMRGFVLWTRR